MHKTPFFRGRWLLAATTALVLAGTAARADEKSDAVLAAAKAASGGAAWDAIAASRSTGTVSTGGLTGSVHSLIDATNGRYTDDFVLGPMSGREGFDGTTAWSVDPSGQPRVEGGGEARLAAVNQAYRNSFAYWYPRKAPRHNDVAGPEAGRRRDLRRGAHRAAGRPSVRFLGGCAHAHDRAHGRAAGERSAHRILFRFPRRRRGQGAVRDTRLDRGAEIRPNHYSDRCPGAAGGRRREIHHSGAAAAGFRVPRRGRQGYRTD
ncbi:MAG: hypothetical protein WDN04_15255 [Rhodospirillales bacterium]